LSYDVGIDASRAALWTGRCVQGVVLGIYALYAWYLVNNLAVFPMETAYMDGQGSPLSSTIWRLWAFAFGSDVIVARSLSVLCALVAIGLTYRVGVALCRDHVSAAFLALSYILFPPLVGIFSLATPHALTAVLSLFAVALILKPGSPSKWWRAVVAGFLVLVALLIGVDDVPADNLLGANKSAVLDAVIMPYAMLWVAVLIGFIALGNATLRERIGGVGVWVVGTAPTVAIAFLVGFTFIGGWEIGQLSGAVGYVFGVAILGVLPFILWVRFVMPEVRAMLAWIAFPVIMYSGFWAVLGPIDRESFPYNSLGVESPRPSTLGGSLNRNPDTYLSN